MIPIDTLIAFILAATLLSLSPGPSNMYIMARSVAGGRSAGIACAAGMAVGSLLYVLATALGLAAVFVYSPGLFLAVKMLGAGYLIYLGITHLRNAPEQTESAQQEPKRSVKTLLRQSLIVELTNPKTALFFMAFLPQFASAEAGNIALQLTILGLIYTVIAFSCDVIVAALSGKLGKWMAQHPATGTWQDRVSAVILLLLGGAILVEEGRQLH